MTKSEQYIIGALIGNRTGDKRSAYHVLRQPVTELCVINPNLIRAAFKLEDMGLVDVEACYPATENSFIVTRVS